MRTLIIGLGAFAVLEAVALPAGPAECKAVSPSTLTPVIELYTSEGCSSCPPADRWLSTLKPVASSGRAVVQAFHVGYWDHIGWIDRFAHPVHTTRQRQVAAWNGLGNIYTPQFVRNGQDWRRGDAKALGAGEPSRASISLRQTAPDAYSASIAPAEGIGAWSAYWTVTEHGFSTKVKAGENAGELLQHDFVVRQYVPLGNYRGASSVTLHAVPRVPGHPRQVNLVVFDPRSGRTLQALSLECPTT